MYSSYYEKIGSVIKNIDDEILFELPNNWVWTRITGIADIIMGSSLNGTSIKKTGNGIEFHQGKLAFTNKIISHSRNITTSPTRIAPANSVLLCVRAPVGEVNITNRDICIGRGLSAIVPFDNINVVFMFYWLQNYKKYLNENATGSTFVAITTDAVKTILLPIPPLTEQNRICNKIRKLYSNIDTVEKGIS